MVFHISNCMPMGFETQNNDVRQRLRLLAARFPQAEIARRTSTSPANVHRYLRLGKVPVSFCAALVQAFQVNPAWLLTGQGGMLLSDVRAPVQQLGGDMLELVETMGAVTRMRLGEITSRPDQQTLRSLSDSLDSLERMRQTLNTRAGPLLQGTLTELRRSFGGMQMDRAGTLIETARKLARLTVDDGLLEQLDAAESSYHYLTARVEAALEFERRVFARRTRAGVIRSGPELNSTLQFTMLLRETGRLLEGRRVCRAVLALAEESSQDPTYKVMQLLEANLSIELGDLADGLATTVRVFPTLTQDNFGVGPLYTRAMLLSGNQSFHDAMQIGTMNGGKARMLMRHAATRENAAELQVALQTLVGPLPQRVPEPEYDTQLAALILACLQGKKRGVSDYDAILRDHPPASHSPALKRVMVAIHRGQVARLGGDKRGLRNAAAETEQALVAAPQELFVKLDWKATRLLNLRAVKDSAALPAAEAELLRWQSLGYRLGT